MIKRFKQKITDYFNSLSSEFRSVIEHRKQKPRTPKLNKVKKVLIILCCLTYLLITFFSGFTSHAVNVDFSDGEPASAPTDLTGYTVTVPAGWSVTAGYGIFDYVSYSISTLPFSSIQGFALGYLFDYGAAENPLVPTANVISSGSTGDVVVRGGQSFSITFFYFDPQQSGLIQWFVDNDAIFVNNNVPDEPDEPDEPTSVTVPAGLYYLQNTYNDLRGSINFSVPFISKSTYFNAITFAGIDNEQYVSINYAGNNILPNVYNGADGWSFAEYSVIYVQSDVELSQTEYALFERAFVSFADNPKLDILFRAGQENGQSAGYSQGFNAGRTEGYNEGFTAGRSDALGDNFMSDFFGGIVRALDALKLFGDISLLNIIEAIMGLMLALWILKLIAGG